MPPIPFLPLSDGVNIFVGRCIDIQESERGKIGIGGMVTLLVLYFGINIPDNVPKLANTTTTIFMISLHCVGYDSFNIINLTLALW